ncbi:hypothetical protein PFICI_02764 [Pestalotiopsis fici W106-1]|uniref:Fungal STAND N-terminal Goodbye domain-containing protein n=1 Tax=Pestalotiopsis fici (strain W106-1 / CGMCC3.15140) TaxID=1229662 RepID=W3XFG6_PESFW|nr:uncharacterized protein PFICI_02764 [Pestalotiopsis fici W106-1]ETS84739.1 hypothetical protein PFICI_02764 [Pestalotiopsis fici W106-1]
MSDRVDEEASPPPGPSITLHSPAIDFIENELPDYHPAFDARHVRFDLSRDQFVPRTPYLNGTLVRESIPSSMLSVPSMPPPSQQLTRPAPGQINEMGFWVELFPKVVQMLQEDPIPSNLDDSKWGIRGLSTWADVQARLDMARREYNFQHGSQSAGSFRRAVRNGLDKHAVAVKQAARFVPDVDLAKPIVGAIHVVIDAYRQASEVKKEVTKSFDDLPQVFENIEFYLRTYQNDESIKRASCHLLRSIFRSIEYAIAFFTSHQAKRAGGAILSGSDYQRNLRDCLNEITAHCNSLQNQAGMSLAHRVTSDNQQMMRQNDAIIHGNEVVQNVLGHIYQQQGQINNFGVQFCAYVLNQVLPILQDCQTARRAPSPITRSPSPMPQSIEFQPQWLPQDIWYRLHMPSIDDDDLRHVLTQTELIIHEDRGRIQQLLENQIFREWMARSNSTRLLVHGDFRTPQDISPLSVICTILSYAFRNAGSNMIGLVFFCGQHQAWDEFQGASAMMRSLIAQLMTQFSFDPMPPTQQFSLQDLDGDDIHVLCDLFTILVQQLPPNRRIFCLIDGINLYEKERYLEEMSIAIMNLVNMVDQSSQRLMPTFKLLLTSPQPTSEVRRAFDSEFGPLLDTRSWPMAGGNISMARMQDQLGLNMDWRS